MKNNLQKKASAVKRRLDLARVDPRFRRVIGKLVRVGLLSHSTIPPYGGPVSLEDALWAGEVEPRVLELIPAILLKRPKLFVVGGFLPNDLRRVLISLRHGTPSQPFRDVRPQDYSRWVDKVGRKGGMPTLLKTYRFKQEDLALLNQLLSQTQKSEIEIIREGLKLFASQSSR